MATACSPLRYPGGKQILARVLGHLVTINGREGGVYAEPYAGGAGAALALLYSERVQRLMLNDADPSVYAFWDSILRKTSHFLKLLDETPVTVQEWQRQRAIYQQPSRHSPLRFGFATFYLNRCNRSGIIGNAGLIGGQRQKGEWKLDARFNRGELRQRIERIALYRDRIHVFNLDAIEFLRSEMSEGRVAARAFVYLDPPYFVKGAQLYMNFYDPLKHAELARYMKQEAPFLWAMSYDDCPDIRALYSGLRQIRFDLGYSARGWRMGKELLISKKSVLFPERWKSRIPGRYITAADAVVIPAAG